jgi:peroxiredoxin
MKVSALLLLCAAALGAPAYLLFDIYGVLPPSLRDRPWPFALATVLLSLAALRRMRRAALFVAFASLAALGWTAHHRYRLPPPSATFGVGTPLADETLSDETGNRVRLRELHDRPLLVVWYRGSWCPFCRRQLVDLADELSRFAPSDLRVVAVSADPPEPIQKMKRELQLPFSLLSDPEKRLVNRCELAHCVAIVDTSGMIRWGVVSGNWEKDLPARALLQAAYRYR